jgi:hypothetical protein
VGACSPVDIGRILTREQRDLDPVSHGAGLSA